MTVSLKRLWTCWVADRVHRRPHWNTWTRFLSQMPKIPDKTEDAPHYQIYRALLESGKYRADPQPRGQWVKDQWVMRKSVS